MLAARLSAPRQVAVQAVAVPTPGPHEVLLRVLACGVCGSDLNAWTGVPGVELPLAPGAPGHEVWGEVAAVGTAVEKLRPGDRVAGLLRTGGYAQYALAAEAEVVGLSDSARDTLLLGEPLACAANVVGRCGWQPGERLAIVGYGYLAALVARLLFPRGGGGWVAVSRRPKSRALALAHGAAAAYGFDEVPPDQWDSFRVVVEAAGVQQTLDYATWLTAYRGRLVIAGYHADGPRTVNLQAWNWKGLDVVNAHERQPEAYVRGLREGLQVVQAYDLARDLEGLVSHRWPLAEVGAALATAERRPPEYVKGVVLPWA